TDAKFANMWHLGYTSAVTCGVWVGFDKPTTLYPNAFSNRIALPIWADIMNATVADYKPEAFAPPEGAERLPICTKSGLLATPFCYDKIVDAEGNEHTVPTTYNELVRPSTYIEGVCTVHQSTGLARIIEDFGAGIGRIGMEGTSLPADAKFSGIEPVHMKSVTVLGNDDPFHSRAPILKAVPVTADGTKVLRAMAVESGDTTASLPLKLAPPKSEKIGE
ncbi:MAG: pbpG 3, partial [Verrucomicrobiaceae bacterium]|nr:pbpG 3 [Verrucomicrobiaceae bacterium]